MRRNPHLKVLVASGRYDLGTPYSASDWSLAQLDVPPRCGARQHRYYDAGHMMYTRQADLVRLKTDLAALAPMNAFHHAHRHPHRRWRLPRPERGHPRRHAGPAQRSARPASPASNAAFTAC
jgi:hypothetical protein